MTNQPVVTTLPILGATLVSVEVDRDPNHENRIEFVTDKGERYSMYHSQDCCESVTIDDICDDLNDLVGSPVTLAEEVSNPEGMPEAGDRDAGDGSHTWTFYRFATAKGTVSIRWFGTSNGYYSESVEFAKIR